eukprot:CAMPEP_0201908140 /NCGR_PEP_ID=MMETSP0903-20130614/335_1 /ASSEMBLY_ACC=CAM_ASM_000552 /TAXON_ID=420261 /ORGANISM="Thalassiosira antarctica, Strain CCMP982" /LENGTH=1352 /DNA_ID=CAMNT_0048442415 /DNA_START=186 /DNA_END=4244 /DNA_ORIENTATION=-
MIDYDNPLQFGPERLILFHSPDPQELGIQLEHGPDGYVRITSVPSDDDDENDGGNNTSYMSSNMGVIEGKIHTGDVLCEAAGVNMRRPISDHMWKLTTGLMKVAPRPIEIFVAVIKPATSTSDSEDNSQDGSYYQLEVGENATTTNAAMHHLPGSPGAISPGAPGAQTSPGNISTLSSPPASPVTAPQAAVRNPFQDADRFGPERRMIFNTESLGIKLHRSPTEGIVHILHVTPYKPFAFGGSNRDYKPPREGPDDGHLEPGDTILEVGGVDLREKAIGIAEWADMVHFIKHVGRPLGMVVSKDKLFTRERAGLAVLDERVAEVQQRQVEQQMEKDEMDVKKEENDDVQEEEKKDVESEEIEKAEDQQENVPPNVQISEQEESSDANKATDTKEGDDNEKNQEIPLSPETEAEDTLFDNVCFSVTADDICNLPADEICNLPADNIYNLPCGTSGSAVAQPASPTRKDNSWIKKSTTAANGHYGEIMENMSSLHMENRSSDDADDFQPVMGFIKPIDVDSTTLPTRKDRPWMKKSTLADDVADMPLSPIECSSSSSDSKKLDLSPVPFDSPKTNDADSETWPVNEDNSWIKESIMPEKKNELPTDDEPSSDTKTAESPMPFHSRTHPTTPGESSVEQPTSPGAVSMSPSVEPADDVCESPFVVVSSENQGTPKPASDSGNSKSVSQLRDMFTPIKTTASARPSSPDDGTQSKQSWHTALSYAVSSLDEEDEDSIAMSPTMKQQATTPAAVKEVEKPTDSQVKGLFSPMVLKPMTPKSPMSKYCLTPKTPDFPSSPQLHSPGVWSATSPMSNSSAAAPRSVANPISVSSVASIRSAAVPSPIAVSPMENPNDADKEGKPPATIPTSPVSASQRTEKRRELAQTILKEKRTAANVMQEEQLPVEPQTPVNDFGIQIPKLEPTPGIETPKLEPTPGMLTPSGKATRLNESSMDESPFHKTFLQNLRDQFDSLDRTPLKPAKESRDDTRDDTATPNKSSFGKMMDGSTRIVAKPEKRNHLLSGWASQSQTQQLHEQHQQQRNDLSPTRSTINVDDKKKTAVLPPSMKKTPKNAPVSFSERSFRGDDGPDSPFVGNIQFASPTQRVPASALFSQAFVVQHQPGAGAEEPTNVRWVQTDSPLFVVKKNLDDADAADDARRKNQGATAAGESSAYLQLHSPRPPPEMPAPEVKGFNNYLSAFDMSVMEDDSELDNPNFLNGTIVYADSTEDDAPMLDCCGVTNGLCGGENMFEGLVSGNCGNMESFRQSKEKVNKIPSPRRKNLLSRLRNKGKSKKSTKASSKKELEYGNLDEDQEEREESRSMKGVRKAHVQLTYQSIRGQTMASASQFSLLLDDEICV